MMAIYGEIERPDHVLFADTGWDGRKTMDHVAWCEKQCQKDGIPFHRVSNGNIRDDHVEARALTDQINGRFGSAWCDIPLFVDYGDGVSRRSNRQCTKNYKIIPLRRKKRELLGAKKGERLPPGSCGVMIGISTDEARRAAPSRDRWADNIYPLIDPLKMSRLDCQKWWEDHYPHRQLGKSSCLGCPNKSDREWLALKTSDPEAWADVVEFDGQIRKATGMRGDSYLHRSCKPLDQVPLGEGQGGLDLEDDIYCAGGCGL
jgi:hypothetical protein